MNKRLLLALAAGFGTNVCGYVFALVILNLGGHGDTPSLLSLFAVFLWLASMILGGWVASVVAGSRQFLLGYLSAASGLLAVTMWFRFLLRVEMPTIPTAVGILLVSVLGVIGALTYSRVAK